MGLLSPSVTMSWSTWCWTSKARAFLTSISSFVVLGSIPIPDDSRRKIVKMFASDIRRKYWVSDLYFHEQFARPKVVQFVSKPTSYHMWENITESHGTSSCCNCRQDKDLAPWNFGILREALFIEFSINNSDMPKKESGVQKRSIYWIVISKSLFSTILKQNPTTNLRLLTTDLLLFDDSLEICYVWS